MSEENQTTPDQSTAENPGAPTEAEIKTALKAKADLLGIKYPNNITIDTLRAKIAEAQAEEEKPAVNEGAVESSFTSIRAKQRAEQMRLVRLRIANMNPDKADLPGEIITVRTKYLGIVKKFIPFGEATENGYHVPYILYEYMKTRKFLQKKTKQNRQTGQISVSTNWVPEFSIEVLDPLTKDELQKLVAQQAAAAGLAAN